MKRAIKIILRAAAFAVAAVLLITVIYGVYLFAAYRRLEDNLQLETENPQEGIIGRDGEYTVMSWNIGYAANSSDYSFFMDGGDYSRAFSEQAVRDNLVGITGILSDSNADFTLLQEVDENGTRTYGVNERKIISDSAAEVGLSCVFAQNFDSPYLFYPFTSPHGANRSGMITLFGFASDGSVRRSLPIDGGLTKILDLDRCYTVTSFTCDDGGTLCLYNVHLSAYNAEAKTATAQWEMLIGDMERDYQAGCRVICGGDFNADLLSDSEKRFVISAAETPSWVKPLRTELIPDGFSVKADGNIPSCRNTDEPYNMETTFVLTVDGFIVSDNVKVLSCENLDIGFTYSDHNPVVMRFAFE